MFSLTTMISDKKLNSSSIAETFSIGEFEQAFDYLDENIVWDIVGEIEIQGKEAVISYCKQVKEYFNSVTTKFEIQDTINHYNKVIVMGTVEFIRDNQLVSTVSACDVYEFKNTRKIVKITSYCIKH